MLCRWQPSLPARNQSQFGCNAGTRFVKVVIVVLGCFVWQAWHFVTFRRVGSRVNTPFGCGVVRFSWQAQHFRNAHVGASIFCGKSQWDCCICGQVLARVESRLRGFALARLREARCCSGLSCYVSAHGPIFDGVPKGNGPTSPLYTSHAALYGSTFYTLRAAPHTVFTFQALHSTPYTPHAVLPILRPTFCALHMAGLHSGLYSLHFTFHILHPELHAPCFTLNSLHSLRRAQHSTLRFSSTLFIPRATLHTWHFTLHALHCTFRLLWYSMHVSSPLSETC